MRRINKQKKNRLLYTLKAQQHSLEASHIRVSLAFERYVLMKWTDTTEKFIDLINVSIDTPHTHLQHSTFNDAVNARIQSMFIKLGSHYVRVSNALRRFVTTIKYRLSIRPNNDVASCSPKNPSALNIWFLFGLRFSFRLNRINRGQSEK